MKIIKGFLKNRSLIVPPNTRPVSLRVKKAIFDLIEDQIKEKKVLDLFSGSGSLGIEAISLGAETSTFVDIRKSSIRVIQMNLSSLKILPRARVYLKDVFKAIKDFSAKKEMFDIIFLDPPYYKGLARKTLQTLDDYDILTPYGYIVVSCYRKDSVDGDYKNLSKVLSRNYGQTCIYLYIKNEESSLSRHL